MLIMSAPSYMTFDAGRYWFAPILRRNLIIYIGSDFAGRFEARQRLPRRRPNRFSGRS
jgi:hypothetical protein